MPPDPYRYFRLEARDLVDQLASGARELEEDRNTALIQRLLRWAHTLKGAARVVKQLEIAQRAHAIEDALSPLREGTGGGGRELVETIVRHLDAIADQVRALAVPGSAPAPTHNSPISDDGLRTVRVDIAEVDGLLAGFSEARTLLKGLRTAAATAVRLQHLADLLVEQLTPGGLDREVRRPIYNPERAHSAAAEMRQGVSALDRCLALGIEQMGRELGQLGVVAEQLRLVSTNALFASLERSARDAAQELGKQVAFEARGGGLRLEGQVLATLQRALVQAIRNSVAHGVEPAAERRAAGKPATGRVSVAVSLRGARIVVECRDDGRGVDFDAVRRVASNRGFLASGTSNLTAQDLIHLLLQGGISTADRVTEVSGRGIGLDVIREAVEQLRGEVRVRSEEGKGTSLELAVPLSLAAVEALLVEVSGSSVAIPLDAVRTSMRIPGDQISWGSTGATLAHEAQAIPFISLEKALYQVRPPAGRTWSVIVVKGAGSIAAVGVDRLLGSAAMVVRRLPEHAPCGTILAGASLDSASRPLLLLDPDGLVSEAQRADASPIGPVTQRLPVLVIDDSLTTRMLEQSILEAAGYEVDLAVSAEEGLETARRRRYALFLVDVEMPGMDGFTFVERVSADPALHDIPAILVTSRTAPADRERGRAVGARGYVVKSEFNQTDFLQMIRPLMG
jgi:two-component system, chemotaxis family, sensor kinase CheA